MVTRFRTLAVLMVALTVPALASAQDAPKDSAPAKKQAAPNVVVRVQSVQDLLKTADYILKLLPDDLAGQLQQGLRAAQDIIDEKTGLEGIDVKNPIGVYIAFAGDGGPTPPIVILIPVADQATLLKALEERLNLKPTKEKDDSYKLDVEQIPFPVYFRFAHGYAYVTVNDPENIDPKSLPKPRDVLGGGKPEHVLSLSVRLDGIPEAMQKLAVGALEDQLSALKEMPLPEEIDRPAIKEFRDKAIDELVANFKNLLEGGQELALRFNIDPVKDEVAVEVDLSGKAGTKLAKDIASIRENKSVAGGAVEFPDSAVRVNLSVALPAALKPLFPGVVDAVLAEAKKQVPGDLLTKGEPLIQALLPTIKAGELDAGLALVGPDSADKYTAVVALKIVDGPKVEAAVKTIVKKELPPEFASWFELDADKLADGTVLHRVKLSEIKDGDRKIFDESAERLLGKNDLFLAFRKDLLVAAVGPRSKELIAKALASKPVDVGVVRIDASLSRLVSLISENDQQLANARKIADKVFGKNPGKDDLIRLSLEGGDSMKFKLMGKGKTLKYLIELGIASREN